MKNKMLFICEVAIFSALGIVFDYLCGSFLKISINGGSINIAMLPIFLVSYKWGYKGGLITGLLVGTIQMLWAGSNIIHPIQAILDYSLAYSAIGIAGFFFKDIQNKSIWKRNVIAILACVIAVFVRLVFATLSGRYYWGCANIIESLTINLSYLLPSMIICIVLFLVLINTLNKFLTIKKA